MVNMFIWDLPIASIQCSYLELELLLTEFNSDIKSNSELMFEHEILLKARTLSGSGCK